MNAKKEVKGWIQATTTLIVLSQAMLWAYALGLWLRQVLP